MPAISGLRSPYDKVGPLVFVGRMFDKIRLHQRSELPADYTAALGKGLDGRACRFLGVEYEALKTQVRNGANDEALLAWCFDQGISRNEHDCEMWNAFLPKVGWRDDRSEFLAEFRAAQGFADSGAETFFDLIEFDEGRPLRSSHV
ncbi:MAG: hypothetical protein SynsKO_07370 [Synoicihabitans sp.]